MRRFLAARGVIIMKENRIVASVPSAYGAPLDVAGQVLVIVKNTERQVSTGVKFEQAETTTHIGSAAFVDSDELDEFLGAFTFISTSAVHMAHDSRDYTEVTYSTRDNVTIGFYQDGQKQQAFVKLGASSPLMFFRVEALQNIRGAVVQAREHVEDRRKAWDSQ
jgi:hypothetical protein